MSDPGTLGKAWVVKCGVCGVADARFGLTRAEAERFFRHTDGWSKTKRRGWLCRFCLADEAAKEGAR